MTPTWESYVGGERKGLCGVAFSGRAGSGKSTLARALRDTLKASGQEVWVLSFAAKIKEEVYATYGLTKYDLGGREALVEHGERRRLEDPLYWCRKVEADIELAQSLGILAVIDDLRFRVEASFLGSRGFWLTRVVAPLRVREDALAEQGMNPEWATTTHESETQLDSWHGFDRFIFRVRGDAQPFVQRVIDDLYPAKKGKAA